MVNKQQEKKRKLRLVERYDNDDYSRYAAPDYSEGPFQVGEEDFNHTAHKDKQNIRIRPEGNWSHPGVSGKSSDDGAWVNTYEYQEQTNFIGYGPRNYKRSDDRIFEDICEILMKHRGVDATHIGVSVLNGVAVLSGKVNSRREKKLVELIVENLPGVQEVQNELNVIPEAEKQSGPDSVTKKDLGVN